MYNHIELNCLGSSGKKLIPKTYLKNIGSNLKKNNTWSVRMPLRISRISRQPLMEKPVRKPKIIIYNHIQSMSYGMKLKYLLSLCVNSILKV